jgi:uncharacterized protein YndB with AHSA1/START domain
MSHELSVTRYIEAAPEQVWEVMTERMEEWWCPLPWRTEVVRLDRYPGGISTLRMLGPNGEVNEHPGFVLAWDDGHRFAFTDAIKPDLMPDGPFMIGIWSIVAEGDGTRYTACARHWSEEATLNHKEMGFEQGWGAVADQLKVLCE